MTQRNRFGVHAAIVTLAVVQGGCGGYEVDAARVGRESAAITGGVADTADPAVLSFNFGSLDAGCETYQQCTAELVSPHVAITAAHCVVGPDGPNGQPVNLFTGPNVCDPSTGVTVGVKETHAHPSFDPKNDSSTADIAVIVLDQPLAIPPLPYNHEPLDTSMIGTPMRMIGYGDNDVKGTKGSGLRRQATAALANVDVNWVYVGTAQATQCYGDSGGPVLLTINGVETIVGVDSNQEDNACDSINSNTRVDTFAAFIDGYVAASDPKPAGDDAGSGGAGATGGSPTGAGSGTEPAPDAGTGQPAAPPSSAAGSAPNGCHLARQPAKSPLSFLTIVGLAALIARRTRRRLDL